MKNLYQCLYACVTAATFINMYALCIECIDLNNMQNVSLGLSHPCPCKPAGVWPWMYGMCHCWHGERQPVHVCLCALSNFRMIFEIFRCDFGRPWMCSTHWPARVNGNVRPDRKHNFSLLSGHHRENETNRNYEILILSLSQIATKRNGYGKFNKGTFGSI